MSSFSRNKGKRAEQQINRFLQEIVDNLWKQIPTKYPLVKDFLGDKPICQRNTIQSDRGGCDVVGLGWLALEIKHQETLHVEAWWKQTLSQVRNDQIPCLVYKQNRSAWRARMYAAIRPAIHADELTLVVETSLEDWLRWFKVRLEHELCAAAWARAQKSTRG